MGANPIAIAAVRRSDQVYYEQVSRRDTLDCGCAYTNSEFPDVPICNFVGEVLLTDDTPDPFGLVERYYRERGLTCHRWVPAADQDPEPVGKLLAPHGFQRRETRAMILPANAAYEIDRRVRVLGARAMRRAYADVVEQRSREWPELAEGLTAVQLERLDDPQYGALVGLLDDEPVGVISIFQVGEIGRICDLYVRPAERRRGIGAALLNHAVMTAARWSLRPICAAVSAENAGGRMLLSKVGFEEGGVMVSFCQPDSPDLFAW